MSTWLDALADVRFQPLVFALLHTIWMGAVAAAVLAILLRRLPASRVSLRYVAATTAQLAIVLAGIVTWVCLDRVALQLPPAGPPLAAAAELEALATAANRSPAEPRTLQADPLRHRVAEGSSDSIAAAASERSGAVRGHWTDTLAALWLVGVMLMLLRMAVAVADAGRLVRSGGAAERSAVELVDRLRRDVGIGRRVRVVSSRGFHCPAVAGVVWPTLVLPVSLMTELSPDAIRAILLHELAHIRRHDYLLNLLQMLVEAVFFFNPAVWWISRQIRIEREACCDALAVRITGKPVEYSQALADWSERQQRPGDRPQLPVAAMAMGDGRRRPLLSRVRRVLFPGERPGVHVSPLSLLGLLLMALLAAGGLWQGTNVVVAVAADILTAAERVERVAEKVEANSPPGRGEGDGPVTLRGTVRTEDGEPLPVPIHARSYSKRAARSIMSAEGRFGESFTVSVAPGVIWLQLQADGYGPGVAGPFNGEPGAVIEGIEIVLPKGFPVDFVVTDQDGNPVAGADVSAGHIIGAGSSHAVREQSDEQGRGVFRHMIEGEYFISADAPGHQDTASVRKSIHRGETLHIELERALPVTGQVLSTDGRPIAGANIQEFVTRGDGGAGNQIHGPIGDTLATTDEEGRFVLDRLVSGSIYDVLIKHPEYGTRVHEGIAPGQKDLRISLGPNYTLEGTLLGDLSSLPQRRGKLYIQVRQEVPVGSEHGRGWYGDEATVDPTGSGGRFTIAGLLPAKTTVTAGEHSITVDVAEPHQEVTLDLTQPSEAASRPVRQVELVLEAEDGAPPRGSIEVLRTNLTERSFDHREEVSLHEGMARFDVPVGAEVRVAPDGVIGYWFEDQAFTVEAGEEPKRVLVDTIAGGAISGRVLLPDGTPAVEAMLTIRALEKPESLRMQSIAPSGGAIDARGRFVITPLPLDATYVVAASKEYNRAVSEPVRLTAAAPTAEVTLEFAPEATAEGVVLSPEGEPLAGIPLKLEFQHDHASQSWGSGFATDRNGHFEVEGLSSTLGVYQVRLAARKTYQPQSVALNPGGSPVTMRLKRGHVLEGRVIDAKTGKPIPGVDVYAHPPQYSPNQPYLYEAEDKTARDGSFRFSNLAPQPYQINTRGGLKWNTESGKGIVPGDGKELIIKATLPEWSPLELAD